MNEQAISLSPLPWQRTAWQQVQDALQRGQLHHAWLLSGPGGVGKRSFARAWSAALLCGDLQGGEACGCCPACLMLASGGHPDAHLLTQDGHLGLAATATLQTEKGLSHWLPKASSARKDVAIDAARSLMERLALAPNRGGRRVVVITPAEAVNLNTANALLKTIEEPPANTVLLFIAEFAQSLPQTIRSRCQQLRFALPPREASLGWLKRHAPQLTAEQLDAAGGAPLKALAWLTEGRFEKLARWTAQLEKVQLRQLDPLAAAAELAREKEDVGELLRHWQRLLHGRLLHRGWDAGHEGFFQQLVESLRLLENSNANPLLTLESLLLRWRQLAPQAVAA